MPDPELPVLTIADLGVLRGVEVGDDGTVEVTITPTYSGCPAMETIRHDIEGALADAGFSDVRIRTVLAPAWTTDWISDRGRAALQEFGIAPPGRRGTGPSASPWPSAARSAARRRRGRSRRFGSTACKALWQCRACGEPFDHMKTL